MTSAEDRAAVLDEIGLLIVESLREHDVVKADNIANFIAAAYPLSELSVGEISAQIMEAAFATRLRDQVIALPPQPHYARMKYASRHHRM